MTEFQSSGDSRLAYVESGAGAPVVIVHGVGGHKEDWAGVAAALAPTHRVFAVDMLGFGESSKSGSDISMPVQARAILDLLDAKGIERASIVGNSVGGWVAATFAATYPERTGRVELIDAAGFRAMFEGEPPANFDPGNAEEMQALIAMLINGPAAEADGFAQAAFDAYVASGEKAIIGTLNQSLFVSPRLEELLPKIAAPTTVLWGADDRLFPSVLAGVFAAQVPGATSVLIDDAGHFPQIDQPEATIAAIKAALG